MVLTLYDWQPHRLAGLSWTGWTASGLLQSTEVSTLDRANESWTRFGWSSFKFGRLIANGKAFIAALMELKELESLANATRWHPFLGQLVKNPLPTSPPFP